MRETARYYGSGSGGYTGGSGYTHRSEFIHDHRMLEAQQPTHHQHQAQWGSERYGNGYSEKHQARQHVEGQFSAGHCIVLFHAE